MRLLTKQMAEREDITEQLKAQDQMLWVQLFVKTISPTPLG